MRQCSELAEQKASGFLDLAISDGVPQGPVSSKSNPIFCLQPYAERSAFPGVGGIHLASPIRGYQRGLVSPRRLVLEQLAAWPTLRVLVCACLRTSLAVCKPAWLHRGGMRLVRESSVCVLWQVRAAFETDLLEVCAPRQANVGLLAYSPLAGGSLSGKYSKGTADQSSRFNLFPGESPAQLIASLFFILFPCFPRRGPAHLEALCWRTAYPEQAACSPQFRPSA